MDTPTFPVEIKMKTINKMLKQGNAEDLLELMQVFQWLELAGFKVNLHFDDDDLPHLTIRRRRQR